MAESFIQYPPNSTGEKARTISESVGGNTVHSSVVAHRRTATYLIFATAITPAVGRLITVLNRHASKVCRIWQFNMYNVGTSAVTGTLNVAEIRRITHTAALAGGTTVTPIQMDTTDGALPSGIDVMTRATSSVTNVGATKRWIYSSDEPVVTTADMDAYFSEWFPHDIEAVYRASFPEAKPFTLRPQVSTFEGFNVEGISGTVGSLAFEILMTVSDE